MNMEAEALQGVCASAKRDTDPARCLLVSYDAFVKINCLLVCVRDASAIMLSD